MMYYVRIVVLLCGLWFSLGMMGILTWTFYKAWTHPTRQTIVDVNSYGEGLVEAIILPIGLLICVPTVVYFTIGIIKGRK